MRTLSPSAKCMGLRLMSKVVNRSYNKIYLILNSCIRTRLKKKNMECNEITFLLGSGRDSSPVAIPLGSYTHTLGLVPNSHFNYTYTYTQKKQTMKLPNNNHQKTDSLNFSLIFI